MDRSVGKWKLPQPTDLKDEEQKEWIQIPRIARTIPFGYEIDKDDSSVLNPINNELDLLDKARKYIKKYSYREVANWLSKNTGRNISHMGLRKRLMHEKQRKNKATSILKWADYAKKAIQKAEELSTKRTSAYKKTEDRISS